MNYLNLYLNKSQILEALFTPLGFATGDDCGNDEGSTFLTDTGILYKVRIADNHFLDAQFSDIVDHFRSFLIVYHVSIPKAYLSVTN